jgi:protein TonB
VVALARDPDVVVPSFRAQKRRDLERRRNAANLRALTTIDPADVADPLVRDLPSERRVLEAIAWSVVASLALHVVIALGARLLATGGHVQRQPYEQAVVVRMIAPAASEPTPVVAPPDRPLPTPTPPAPAPIVHKAVETKSVEPPADPIEVPPPPPPPVPRKEPRRIVGIDMESTTVGGAGETFAVGNTRMGETAEVAQDPTSATPLAATFTPPKRTTAPAPDYPPSLRAKGVEGDVGLRVAIDATGRVVDVAVTVPSGHAEFDGAAVDDARRSVYEPARVNGVGVARSIEFTVRFRLRQ